MPRHTGQPGADEDARVDTRLSDEFEDERATDLDVEPEPSFRRAERRIPVRRGTLNRQASIKLRRAITVAAVLGALVILAAVLYRYGTQSWRFRVGGGDNVEISGTQKVTRAQVLEALGGDIGRNVFFISLEERKKRLEQIPWVESATVMRVLPNRLKIHVKERTPVAFVQIGSRVSLIDANGVIMDIQAGTQGEYSFPVILGMTESEPLSTRAARMKIYSRLIQELDSEGAKYSRDLSEVDLSDPDNVRAMVADPQGAVLLHLGDTSFLARYKTFIAHVQQWRQQFQKLDSVDLRYDRQVIVNPDGRAAVPRAGATPVSGGTPRETNKGHGQTSGQPARRN